MVPERWHVYVVDLEPRVGTKPGKQRPCLVIQPTEFAAAGLPSSVGLPLTTHLVDDAFPLRGRIPRASAAGPKTATISIDQILAWDNALFREDLGLLPEALQGDVRAAMRDFLDL